MSETVEAEDLISIQAAIVTLKRHGRDPEAALLTRVFVEMTRQAHRQKKAAEAYEIPF